jgi:cell division protein FtsN
MAITFDSAEIDTMSRGTGPSVANNFIAAVQAQLALAKFATSGFSITVEEFKSALGYTGNAKTPNIVWAVNKHLEDRQIMIRCGVRSDGKRVSFKVWDGRKRVHTPKAEN